VSPALAQWLDLPVPNNVFSNDISRGDDTNFCIVLKIIVIAFTRAHKFVLTGFRTQIVVVVANDQRAISEAKEGYLDMLVNYVIAAVLLLGKTRQGNALAGVGIYQFPILEQLDKVINRDVWNAHLADSHRNSIYPLMAQNHARLAVLLLDLVRMLGADLAQRHLPQLFLDLLTL